MNVEKSKIIIAVKLAKPELKFIYLSVCLCPLRVITLFIWLPRNFKKLLSTLSKFLGIKFSLHGPVIFRGRFFLGGGGGVGREWSTGGILRQKFVNTL